jgi:hypothetical protein
MPWGLSSTQGNTERSTCQVIAMGAGNLAWHSTLFTAHTVYSPVMVNAMAAEEKVAGEGSRHCSREEWQAGSLAPYTHPGRPR